MSTSHLCRKSELQDNDGSKHKVVLDGSANNMVMLAIT